MEPTASKEMKKYLGQIEQQVKAAYEAAKKARSLGYDPEDDAAVPLAKNMAERVEGLISTIVPEIENSGLSQRIKELEKKFGDLDWRVALTISLEVSQEKLCRFSTKLKAMETGIRVGIAYLTLGIVASPIEGFVELRLNKRKDGREYFCLMYSGPIRSAGGTAAAVSTIVSDYVRKQMGYLPYDPTEDEINRTVTELYDYHERVTNLQYLPSREEISFLAKNLPIQVSGDPSEEIEVSRYKDLERIETNRIRSGVCLVIGEGIAQKAPKLWKQVSKWGKDFGLDEWLFLGDFIKLQKKVKSKSTTEDTGKVAPIYTYISDLVAGRPVLTHPLREGGFRLRYGRARTSGYSSASIHPALTYALNGYIAIGTQLKVERPGKAAAMSCCDTIEGPVVKLTNGDVLRLETTKQAKKLAGQIKEILFMGDILFSYGDFFNRAHPLLPPGYCEEWWVQELEKATVSTFGNLDLDKLSEITGISPDALDTLLRDPLGQRLTALASVQLSKKLGIPLYPYYTYHWNLVSSKDLLGLLEWLSRSSVVEQEGKIHKIVLPLDKEKKRTLEVIGLPHRFISNEYVLIEKEDALVLSEMFSLSAGKGHSGLMETVRKNMEKKPVEIINLISPIKLRDKSGYFIGARMGRPEKAKMRKLTGSPHVLFPVGDEGGKLRCFQTAMESGKITAEFPLYRCPGCSKETVFSVCESCGKKAKKLYFCKDCGVLENGECKHGTARPYMKKSIDINSIFKRIMGNMGEKTMPDLIKGVRGTSNKDHIPEHLAKGILRAKHDIYVNKDGTTRYDMTQLAITHFKPKEIQTSIEKLKVLGYVKDIYGKELVDPGQVLELRPQDLILPACDESPEEGADQILFRLANFIDDLLVEFYHLKPFYSLRSPADLAGKLVIALAPHTSAATTGRIIGFSKTLGFYAHPIFHAATRRDCDGDEASVTLIMDILLNFSRQFLPNNRGATQDAPLVLTSALIPAEVDDMVFDLDVAKRYPLEFYEACLQYKQPWDVEIDQLGKRLNKEGQYEDFWFTHDLGDLNDGKRCSAYKTLPSMEEKLKGQMDLAEKIRAVDTGDVARLVIEKHFIRDIKGNLRKFSQQVFRCVNCNQKYRRPPLVGKCTKCGGKIIFTISEGSIIKYLEPAISLAAKYDLPSYLKLSLELTKRRVEGIFGKEKEKQIALGQWFG
ncbi:DNA polymerase II large subunit [Candidatus Woesearchaeota archaeon]|nr:DNA polymerase II large subunit [Candidatus Woesearchaeota archaeon]